MAKGDVEVRVIKTFEGIKRRKSKEACEKQERKSVCMCWMCASSPELKRFPSLGPLDEPTHCVKVPKKKKNINQADFFFFLRFAAQIVAFPCVQQVIFGIDVLK